MSVWLIILLVVVSVVSWEIYSAWIHRELYVRDRTPAEGERAEQFRTRALCLIAATLVLEFFRRQAQAARVLGLAEWITLAGTYYYIIRATQRVSTARTIVALFFVLLGFGFLLLAVYLRVEPQGPGRGVQFGLTRALLIVVGLGILLVASRLSRP